MGLAETFPCQAKRPLLPLWLQAVLGESFLSLSFSLGICCLVTVDCCNWSKLCSIMSDVFVLKANRTAQEHSSKEKKHKRLAQWMFRQ